MNICIVILDLILYLVFLQSIPVYNGGDRRAEYEVGVTAFQDLDNINYHVPLFECLEPKGVIEPRQRKLIECLFSPMEPMKYTVKNIYTYTVYMCVTRFGEMCPKSKKQLLRYC